MDEIWDKIKQRLEKTKDLAHVGVANIAGKAIVAVFWFYLASLLGAESYGEMNYLIAIATTAAGLSIIGGTQTITVYTAKHVPIQPPLYLIALVLGTIGSIVVYFVSENVAVSVFVIGYVIYNIITAELLGRKFYKKFAVYFVLQKVLFVAIAVGLYFVLGITGIILGYALSFLIFSGRIASEFKQTKLDFSVLRPRAKFIIYSYGLTIEDIISSQTDKLIIAPLFGFVLLGNYNLSFQFLSVFSMIPAIVFQYMLPQDASGVVNARLKKITVITSVVISALAIILTPIFIPMLFPKYIESIQLIQIMSISAISNAVNVVYSSRFYGQEMSNIVLYGQGILIAIYISGIFVLGGLLGINGVAISFVLASISQSIFFVTMSRIQSRKV